MTLKSWIDPEPRSLYQNFPKLSTGTLTGPAIRKALTHSTKTFIEGLLSHDDEQYFEESM